jgi:hypothetical protein
VRGGIKRIAPDVAEIKRMYVVPRRAAGARCAGLEEAARARLWLRAPRHRAAPAGAMTLYAAEGYTEIGNFNANPIAAYWGEKKL